MGLKANAIDEAACAIRALKKESAELQQIGEQFTAKLDELEASLRGLCEHSHVDPQGDDDRLTIDARLRRLRELKNMMELGGFLVEVNRKMDAAWQRLP